jgi:hypothetical protein
MSKNCRNCAHFLTQLVYRYNKNGNIIDVERTMKCLKIDMVIQLKNSEEKNNESRFIPSKCYQGKHFVPTPQINIEKIVCRDV